MPTLWLRALSQFTQGDTGLVVVVGHALDKSPVRHQESKDDAALYNILPKKNTPMF